MYAYIQWRLDREKEREKVDRAFKWIWSSTVLVPFGSSLRFLWEGGKKDA